MVVRTALSCALALVALAGCGSTGSAEPEAVTVTVTATPTPVADPTPTQDTRCVEARSVVAGALERFWTENVAPKRSYVLFNIAMGAMNDLTNLSRNELSTHGCVNDQFTNLVDAIAQVNPDSPLFEQQKVQVLNDIQAMG